MATVDEEVSAFRAPSNCIHLQAFLLGTVDSSSSLCILRGKVDLLRRIWELACAEWFKLHIDSFYGPVPELLPLPSLVLDRSNETSYPKERLGSAGTPCAIMEKSLAFPPPISVPPDTFKNQGEESHLYVNMMPLDLANIDESLPDILKPYEDMIRCCMSKVNPPQFRPTNLTQESWIVYLTIDERPVEAGQSQRRGGLHVESPGMLPVPNGDGGVWLPGAEHHWGQGIMMRQETTDGGIFMVSNVTNSTAVYNCYLRDEEGDIIGSHGDIERLRYLIEPEKRLLKAGELLWMTDKTPHESLRVEEDTHRQYFRLVMGNITAWFSEHSTENPNGTTPPICVRIVRGNKFDLFPKLLYKWRCGDHVEVQRMKELQLMRHLLFYVGLGHLADKFVEHLLITNVSELIEFILHDVLLRRYYKRGMSTKVPKILGWLRHTNYHEYMVLQGIGSQIALIFELREVVPSYIHCRVDAKLLDWFDLYFPAFVEEHKSRFQDMANKFKEAVDREGE